MTTDADDWTLAIAGDGEAFGRVFDRHRERVFRHAVRLVPSPADADDVVAVAFLELWRKRRSARQVDGSLLPWLLVTSTNAARNIARSSRRYRALLARLPPGAYAPDPADRPDDSDAERALASLPLPDQQVITLCVVHSFSEREAAEALGIAAGTVKSRLSRAKKRLRERVVQLTDEATTEGSAS